MSEVSTEIVATEAAHGLPGADLPGIASAVPASGGGSLAQSSVEAELSGLREQRRKNPAAFWRNEAAVRRERELIEMQVSEVATPPAASEGEVFRMPGSAAWVRLGFDPAAHGYASRIATAAGLLAAGVPDENREALRHSFHALPEHAQAMALAELGNRRPAAAEAVVTADLDALRRSLPALAGEWGGDAPVRLGVVRARLWRALDAMDDADAIAAVRWLDNLPVGAMTALARALA